MPHLPPILPALLLLACTGRTAIAPPPASPPAADRVADSLDPAALVAAEDRSEADRALDAGRRPAELLTFLDVKPGERVADLMAGGGYTTELLARAVGPTGVVYGQNSPWVLERFAEKPWSERLARPVNRTVQRLDRDLDDPLGDVHDLDAVSLVLFYHDAVWQGVDRAAMNRAVFAGLRPGGRYLVVDHSAADGAGVSVAKTLHRIEESVVRDEVQAAGFKLVKAADFLRNPDDIRDWSASPGAAGDKRGTSDRFVLLFEKPRE